MSTPPNAQDITVLVIDDNEPLRELIKAFLRMNGFQNQKILLSQSAEKGFKLFCEKADKIDIIIVDWMMDGMDGLDFTRMVRTSDKSPNPHVPVILLTSHSHLQRVHEARDAGVNEFLAKPINDDALAARIQAALSNPRHFIRAPEYTGPDRRRHRDETFKAPKRRTEDKTPG